MVLLNDKVASKDIKSHVQKIMQHSAGAVSSPLKLLKNIVCV